MAELVGERVRWTFEIPEGVDDETALGCGIAGLTGWLAVSWRAPVPPDDTVLVLGASGTLGERCRPGGEAARREAGDRRRAPGRARARDRRRGVRPRRRGRAAGGKPDRRRALGRAARARARRGGERSASRPPRPVGRGLGDAPVRLGAGQGRRHLRALALLGPPRRWPRRATGSSASTPATGEIAIEIETYPLEAIGEAWQRQASGSPGAKIVVSF